MKLFSVLAILCIIVNSHLSFGEKIWKHYMNGNEINDIEIHGEFLWCATNGSLVRWNRSDTTYRQFTVMDWLNYYDIYGVGVDKDGYLWLGYKFIFGKLQYLDGNNPDEWIGKQQIIYNPYRFYTS